MTDTAAHAAVPNTKPYQVIPTRYGLRGICVRCGRPIYRTGASKEWTHNRMKRWAGYGRSSEGGE